MFSYIAKIMVQRLFVPTFCLQNFFEEKANRIT